MSDKPEQDKEETHKFGPYILRKAKPGPASSGIEPTYAICTPDRWGMRYSDRDPMRPGQLMYPLARDYAKAMQDVLLNQVQWGNAYFGPKGASPALRLTWPVSRMDLKGLFDLLQPVMSASLTSSLGGFGLPVEAIPKIIAYAPKNPSEQGCFEPNAWQMSLNFDALREVFSIDAVASDMAGRKQQTHWIRELADTIYHESRHCQQFFWIYALIMQHPDNFESLQYIAKWPEMNCVSEGNQNIFSRSIVALARQASLPGDMAALVSIKRMAVGMYFSTLWLWKKVGYRPEYMHDDATFDIEYRSARALALDLLQHVGLGGTAIDVDAMVEEPWNCRCDYTQRPWENDAFSCGDMATAYWQEGMGFLLKTYPADQCSYAYEFDYTHDRRKGASGGN